MRPGEIEHTPALIINLDEAQILRGSLQIVLEIISRPLFSANCRVLLTVAGKCTSDFREAIVQSNVSLQPIILPILTETHLSTILCYIFGVEANQLPQNVVHVMKWFGGVPRYLEFFLKSVAKKSTTITLKQIWEWLCTAENELLMDVILYVRSYHTCYLEPPDFILDNVFSISVAEWLIALDVYLDKEWTVEDAQNCSVLHWNGIPGGPGIATMIPLI